LSALAGVLARRGADNSGNGATVRVVEVAYLVVLILTLVAVAGVAAHYLIGLFGPQR